MQAPHEQHVIVTREKFEKFKCFGDLLVHLLVLPPWKHLELSVHRVAQGAGGPAQDTRQGRHHNTRYQDKKYTRREVFVQRFSEAIQITFILLWCAGMMVPGNGTGSRRPHNAARYQSQQHPRPVTQATGARILPCRSLRLHFCQAACTIDGAGDRPAEQTAAGQGSCRGSDPDANHDPRSKYLNLAPLSPTTSFSSSSSSGSAGRAWRSRMPGSANSAFALGWGTYRGWLASCFLLLRALLRCFHHWLQVSPCYHHLAFTPCSRHFAFLLRVAVANI